MTVRRIPLAYNNLYAWERGGVRVLIDAGPDYRGAWDELSAALDGWRPDLVVATHSHSDHSGLGTRWLAAGVPVAIGAADAAGVIGPDAGEREANALAEYLAATGAPDDVLASAMAGLGARRLRERTLATPGYRPAGRGGRYPSALRRDPFVPSLTIDAERDIADGLRAVPCPGHTPGNLVVFDERERLLFSGDQLLPEITPTPALQWVTFDPPRRFPSLPRFVDSLAVIRHLDAERCLPGHGEPFADVAAVIDGNLAQIAERTERVRAAAVAGATTWNVCERLYPRAARRRFWQILATVQGHLDLVAEGR